MLNIGNNLSVDVYANQQAKTGRDYSHQANRNALLKVGTELKKHSKDVKMTGSTMVKIRGQAGTIVIDGSGITLKGKVTVKGDLVQRGGSPEAPQVLSLTANEAKPTCEVCEAMKNQKQG
ncbi:type IV secretion protein Rhs [Rodentibacter genomosp. 2]|nr:type IV secretion protein Rhs [Rodentibacter genomosp. 2]